MNLIEAMKTRRSIRKFTQEKIPYEVMTDILDCARLAPYPANVQPLKFCIIDEPSLLEKVFECTKWAGYLEDGTPTPDERPTAYIAIFGDTDIKNSDDFKIEVGAAGAVITLAAMEYGVASCWLGALAREKLTEILGKSENLLLQDIIALGYPCQESEAVDMSDGNIRYYLDGDKLKVPKRSLEEIIIP